MKKSGIALLAALALVTAGIALFDWNLLKDYAETRVHAAAGRQLEIGGTSMSISAGIRASAWSGSASPTPNGDPLPSCSRRMN